jgi:hypothetical protein
MTARFGGVCRIPEAERRKVDLGTHVQRYSGMQVYVEDIQGDVQDSQFAVTRVDETSRIQIWLWRDPSSKNHLLSIALL